MKSKANKVLSAFGLKKAARDINKHVELSEICFTGSHQEIQRLADFLALTASEMKTHGRKFGHTHYRDEFKRWAGDRPDVIVARGF